MAGRNIFQRDKTVTSYKVIYRNIRKCSYDTNMDCFNNNTRPKALRAMAKYPWYLSNLVAFIRLNIFVKINLQNWLDQPFVDPEPPPENNRQGVLF